MNKIFTLLLAIIAVGNLTATAEEIGEVRLTVGRQIGPEELKSGDTIVFRNGMTNHYDLTCDEQDLTKVFLCGTRLVDSRGWGGKVVPTLGVLKGLSTDNIFVAQKTTSIVGPDGKRYTAFIFKHVDTGLYITMTDDLDHGGSGLDVKSKATAFALGYAKGYTTNTAFPENQNEKSAYLFRFINGEKFHYGPAWNYGFSEQTKNKDNICWNIFEPIYASATAFDLLETKYQEMKTFKGFEFGKDPGFYDNPELFYGYEDAVWSIGEKLRTGEINEGNADKWLAYLDSMQTTLEESFVPITEGYYYIVNAGCQFNNAVLAKRAMTANGIHELNWTLLDKNNPFQFFKFIATSDSTWNVQNVCTGEYIGGLNAKGSVSMVRIPETNLIFSRILTYPEWNITNTDGSEPYVAYNYQNGNTTYGTVKAQTGGHNTASAWILEKETDQAKINKLVQLGKEMYFNTAMKEIIADGKEICSKVKEYKKMITSELQFNSNSKETTVGSYSALIDGTPYSYYQSEITTTKATSAHNLQVDLGKTVAISKFKFTFSGMTSESSSSAHDTPNDIEIYATNNTTLGLSARSKIESWTQVTHLENMDVMNTLNTTYTSDEITMDQPYRFIRFVVRGTTSGNKNTRTGQYYFNLTNFQIYSSDSEDSQYFAVPGMKETCDKLEGMIKISEEKIAEGTVTQKDIDDLYECVSLVQYLYVDRDKLDDQLADLIKEADELFVKETVDDRLLLTDPSQLSTNSQNSPGYTLAQLIDGEVDGYAGMESVWTEEMTKSSVTISSWEKWLAENRSGNGQIGIGHGYHNFQVALPEPVSNFYMVIYGRDNTDYHDTPCKFEILATNDDKLGASTNNADASKWTKITDLDATKDIPDERKVVYTSPKIELGEPFKYIRIVIKNTTLHAADRLRNFANPDVTGITWNAVEWQMYESRPVDSLLYYNNEEFKTVLDNMKALSDADKTIPKKTMIDNTQIHELRAAIDAVFELKSYILSAKPATEKIKNVGVITTLDGVAVTKSQLQRGQIYVVNGKLVKLQ